MSATAQADYLEFVATARARGSQMVTQSHKNSARSSLESTVNTFSTGLQNTMRTESRVAGHELFNLPDAEWVEEIGGGAMAWGALNSLKAEKLPNAIEALRKSSYAMVVSLGTLADTVEHGTDNSSSVRSRSRTTLTELGPLTHNFYGTVIGALACEAAIRAFEDRVEDLDACAQSLQQAKSSAITYKASEAAMKDYLDTLDRAPSSDTASTASTATIKNDEPTAEP
ncbi:hypothetical protein EHS25_006049 [Saitozyma podzolica]|uniref:Uncharacterized protein n=1 Tax=Saitozyma podzolica TaxID=1890683 RepID=A0A427XT95_9TREE|nr:hypothetical protein EHS25_006049 [Saitozyma podzolica]